MPVIVFDAPPVVLGAPHYLFVPNTPPTTIPAPPPPPPLPPPPCLCAILFVCLLFDGVHYAIILFCRA